MPPKSSAMGKAKGRNTFQDQVVDPICHSQPGPGMIRMAPSANPMYQSGWDPAVTCAGAQPAWYMGFAEGAIRIMPGPGWDPAQVTAGLYGPKTQTGLICISAPIKVTTPKTMKKKPPAL